jgi:hypothetical protein
MNSMIAAYPWHYWLAIVLLLAGVLALLQVVVGYVIKVTATRYPNRRQRKAAQQKSKV